MKVRNIFIKTPFDAFNNKFLFSPIDQAHQKTFGYVKRPLSHKSHLAEKIKTLLTGPFAFSLPFTLMLLILLPVEFSKFKITTEKVEPGSENTLLYYAPVFPGEKNCELFLANYRTNANLTLNSHAGRIIETYNFPGFWDERFSFKLRDIDGDSIPEFFTITVNRNDSIFISMVDFTGPSSGAIHHFLTSVRKVNGNTDHEQELIEILDNNGDGSPEVLACISAGYALQPRKVYAWDLLRDSIRLSPLSGMKINPAVDWAFHDLDKDGIMEIFYPNSAVNNFKEPIPYSDSASWLAVLTKDLSFYREPVYLKGRQSVSRFKVLEEDEMEPRILAHVINHREGNRTLVYLFNKEFGMLDSIVHENPDLKLNFLDAGERPLFINNGEKKTRIYVIDFETHAYKLIKELPFSTGNFETMDLDEDGSKEYLTTRMFQNSTELIILSNNLAVYTRVKLPGRIVSPIKLSIKENNPGKQLIMFDAGLQKYLLTYSRNPYYPLRFVLPLVVYVIITSLFFIFQRMIISTTLKRKEAHDRLQTYQLQSVMNQLNPHFTFNAINSIGHAILTGHKEEAHRYFVKLSSLIRKTMYNALSPVKTLAEEIEFVKEYLEIEEYRHSGKLKWEIHIDERVNQNIEIPKMLIQIFTENSVKHGLLHKEGTGNIEIRVLYLAENHVGIEITDDGVGRERASSIVQSKGKGLKIFRNYIDIYNQRYNTFISFTLQDLYPLKENRGTKINIDIFIRGNSKKKGVESLKPESDITDRS